MSEEKKKERTIAEVQQEYQNLCLKAGHTQYQIYALEKELSAWNSTLRDLNFEAASLQAKEKEAAAPEAPAASQKE